MELDQWIAVILAGVGLTFALLGLVTLALAAVWQKRASKEWIQREWEKRRQRIEKAAQAREQGGNDG